MRSGLNAFLPILWIVAFLVVADVSINLLFPYPDDPRNISPSMLQRYFEHGRSTEAKFYRMTRGTDSLSAPIVSSGWPDSKNQFLIENGGRQRHGTTVTVYGMSHAGLLAADLAKCDSSLEVSFCGAPGAVPTWSYAAFAGDSIRRPEVVILAVMTAGLPLITTTSGATMMFDFAYPYTYPRYYLDEGELVCVRPPFLTVEGYREHLYDAEKWRSYTGWLERHDKYYDPVVFKASAFDRSSLCRLLRRSYALITRRSQQSEVLGAQGFNVDCEEVQICSRIIVEFAKLARSRHSRPIIYLVNNLNTGDQLYRALRPALERSAVPFLSSHILCPPDNPHYYLADSHFEPRKNLELAHAMANLIRENLTMDMQRQDVEVPSVVAVP